MTRDDQPRPDEDPLLSQALELVRNSGSASPALLQRILRVDHARAVRILEQLEARGALVGGAPPARRDATPRPFRPSDTSRSRLAAGAVAAGVLVVAAWFLFGRGGSDPAGGDGTSTPSPLPAERVIAVVYRLDGSASSANLTYTGQDGEIQQQPGVAVPLVRAGTSEQGLIIRAESGDFVVFAAQNTGDTGQLECTIEVAYGRGESITRTEVVATGGASGGHTTAECSATLP
jgi:hypothetical protein